MEIQIEFFSQNLRNLREEREMTQENLARILGVSRQSIIALERGRCLPSLPLVIHFAEVFDMALEDILRPTSEATEIDEPSESLMEMVEQENEWLAQIKLPENIDQEKIDVELKNGILNIILPKIPKDEPKAIKIKVKTN
jgi:putative transcriptional regulator